MHLLRRIPSWRSLPRRLCAGLTLLAYLATALGLPLPAAGRPKDGEPFPCQDHPCGCRTAEQCWRGCCCFTPEQRLAWAKANNIEPPAYAEKPKPATSWRTTRLRDRGQGNQSATSSCSCCPPQSVASPKSANISQQRKPEAQAKVSHSPSLAPQACVVPSPARSPGSRPAPPAATRKARPVTTSCCVTKANPETGRSSEGQPAKPCGHATKRGVSWGLGVSAQGCQGATTLWASAGTVLPPPAPLTWSPCLVPLGWLPPAADMPALLTTTPPDPPPRDPSV
jgi:hypothetical protein